MNKDLRGTVIDACNGLHDINFHMDVFLGILDAVYQAMSKERKSRSAYTDALWGVCDKAYDVGKTLKELQSSLEGQLEDSIEGQEAREDE